MSNRQCLVTLEEFMKSAKTVECKFGSCTVLAVPTKFKTGSFGFNMNGRIVVLVGDKEVQCQVSGNIVVFGSKDMPK